MVTRAREEAAEWRSLYKSPMPVSSLADRLGYYTSVYTMVGSVRPFGITAILAGFDSEEETQVDAEVGVGPEKGAGGKVEGKSVKRGGPGLYMIEPSGLYWVSPTSHDKNPLAAGSSSRRLSSWTLLTFTTGILRRSHWQRPPGSQGRAGET